jgi:hypothetical protein
MDGRPTLASATPDPDSDLVALQRRWRSVGLIILSTVLLATAALVLLFPLGDDGDSYCGNVFQSVARHSGVCRDRAQLRLIVGIAVGLLAVCLGVAASIARRRQRSGL